MSRQKKAESHLDGKADSKPMRLQDMPKDVRYSFGVADQTDSTCLLSQPLSMAHPDDEGFDDFEDEDVTSKLHAFGQVWC